MELRSQCTATVNTIGLKILVLQNRYECGISLVTSGSWATYFTILNTILLYQYYWVKDFVTLVMAYEN